MKYINRNRLGIELFFSRFLSNFSEEQQMSLEGYDAILQQYPLSLQLSICNDVQKDLKKLVSSHYQIKKYIPSAVRYFGENSFARLLPTEMDFFCRWIKKLQQRNRKAKREWENAFYEVSSKLDFRLKTLISSCNTITYQQVLISSQGKDIKLSFSDHLWGKIDLLLKNAVIAEKSALLPKIGYLFWIEAEASAEGNYEFRFALDEEFSDTPYTERLLMENNWEELTVQCTDASIETVLYDYPQRLSRNGSPSWDVLCGCCYELLHKNAVAEYALSYEERRNLCGVAQLFLYSGLLDHLYSRHRLNFIAPTNIMENHYLFSNTVYFLRQTWKEEGSSVCDILDKALTAFEESNHSEFIKQTSRSYAILKQKRSDGTLRNLTLPLLQKFREGAFADQTQYYPFAEQIQVTEKILDEFYSPLLQKEFCFQGAFPHFYRIRGDRAEFFSFVLKNPPVVTISGKVNLTYSIALAQMLLPIEKLAENNCTISGLPIEQCRAEDFILEDVPYSAFALVGDDIDGQSCSFSLSVTEDKETLAARSHELRRQAAEFQNALTLALDSLDCQPIPLKARTAHIQYLKKKHCFRHLFFQQAYLWVLILLIGVLIGAFFTRTTEELIWAIISFAVAGIIAPFVLSWLEYRKKKSFVWNRDKK